MIEEAPRRNYQSSMIEQYERDNPIEENGYGSDTVQIIENQSGKSADIHQSESNVSVKKSVNFAMEHTDRIIKRLEKPKKNNPFAKSVQSNDIPLETRVDTNPLEAAVLLMKKKPIVVSSKIHDYES